MDTSAFRELLSIWGPRVLAAVAILLITHFVAKAVKWAVLKLVGNVKFFSRAPARDGESLGTSLGALAYWLIWLVGLLVAVQPLQLTYALAPIQTLTNEVFGYLPRIAGAALIFFIGVLLARIARNVVEAGLAVLNFDGLLARVGSLGVETGEALPSASAPAAAPPPASRNALSPSRLIGAVVYALVVIPVSIAALQTLGIESIVVPTVAVLQTVLEAIPRVIAAALLLAIAYFIARWVRDLVEKILASLGFDESLGSLGDLSSRTKPSRVAGLIALTAIMLFSAIEAARLVHFDAVAGMLAQVTDLGGRVVFGSVIVVFGVVMGRIVARVVGDSVGESGLPSLLKYAVIALAVAIGLRFMGLANEIVNLAFGLILGAAAVACALAFGLGGRETAHRLLQKWTGEGLRRKPTDDDGIPPV
ncbi:MAG: mechanosensitive ion channel [Burkholderiaceae bacterium]